MASNTLSSDPRLLSLPEPAFNDCIELLDGVCATLKRLEQQLRDHFETREPVDSSVMLGLIRVSLAGCRVVNAHLLEAEGQGGAE